MPESVRDRPTNAHEKIYLMSKAPRYFYDAEAIREPASYLEPNAPDAISSPYGQGFTRRAKGHANGFRGGSYVGGEPGPRTETGNTAETPLSRNARNVWTIATAPFSDSHFATFPPALVEKCLKAGTSEKGVCSECGKPWERVEDVGPSHYAELGNVGSEFDRGDIDPRNQASGGGQTRNANGTVPSLRAARRTTTGWGPSCSCDAPTAPAVVLDVFGGAGTTGLVAARLGRRAILLELNEDYAAMARKRIDRDWMGEDERRAYGVEQDDNPGPLFA